MSYKYFRALLVALLVLYWGAGYYYSKSFAGERYPFFSWFVFSRIPPRYETEDSIRLLELNGARLSPPLLLKDAYRENYFAKGPGLSISQYRFLARSLGSAVGRKNEELVRRYRTEIENGLLGNTVVYEVVRVRYDTIEFWKSGAVQSVEPLATFTVER